jgi:D-glycero-D-manno-heptose 1,7-bisphosphate phosphatase
VDLPSSVMVGDRESDVLAGQAAGCWTVRLAQRDPEQAADSSADHVAPDLAAAVDWILNLTLPKPPVQRS